MAKNIINTCHFKRDEYIESKILKYIEEFVDNDRFTKDSQEIYKPNAITLYLYLYTEPIAFVRCKVINRRIWRLEKQRKVTNLGFNGRIDPYILFEYGLYDTISFSLHIIEDLK